MDKQYSPKLKEIMSEVEAILRRNDVAAYVVLHEPGFSEYLLAIDPTWSILSQEGPDIPGWDGIAMRSKLEDYGGDREHQRRNIENTANLLHHLTKHLLMHGAVFNALHDKLGEVVTIEHTEDA